MRRKTKSMTGWAPSPFRCLARLVYRWPLTVYAATLSIPVICTVAALQYRTELDTGILSFRARDEPYAVHYDAVLAAIQWGKGHTRHREGPPSPPAPVNAPPPVPKVERLQSHPASWLTVVYETSPPGGDVLTPERLAFVARVEGAVRRLLPPDAVAERRSKPPNGVRKVGAQRGGRRVVPEHDVYYPHVAP